MNLTNEPEKLTIWQNHIDIEFLSNYNKQKRINQI